MAVGELLVLVGDAEAPEGMDQLPQAPLQAVLVPEAAVEEQQAEATETVGRAGLLDQAQGVEGEPALGIRSVGSPRGLPARTRLRTGSSTWV